MYLLPIIITASLGAQVNALFFTSFLISTTMDQVAINFASSLTVEGSHTPGELPRLIRHALQRIFSIILPAIVSFIVISPWDPSCVRDEVRGRRTAFGSTTDGVPS